MCHSTADHNTLVHYPTLATRVALVAVHAVVHVAVHLRVVEVVRIIPAVAASALEDGVIVRIRMARRAHAIGIAVIDGEARVLRVIERRRSPASGRMARRALRRREERRLRRVSRIRCVGVQRLVTADARQRERRVVIVHMAVRASSRRHRVQSRQREWRVVVIERRIRPQDGVVAEFAGRREARVRHRRGCVVVVRLVARNARRHRNAVIVVLVAVDAGQRRRHVRPYQRESGRSVIKLPIRPQHCIVAALASSA